MRLLFDVCSERPLRGLGGQGSYGGKVMASVEEHFRGYFENSSYDGSQDDTRARHDFSRLTDNWILWTQVHGDFKDVAKRCLFEPYPYWHQLYLCCKQVVEQSSALGNQYQYWGPLTNAKMMGDVMTVMRQRYKLNTPRWWLPIMNKLRDRKGQ
jgi:hypothetical protein